MISGRFCQSGQKNCDVFVQKPQGVARILPEALFILFCFISPRAWLVLSIVNSLRHFLNVIRVLFGMHSDTSVQAKTQDTQSRQKLASNRLAPMNALTEDTNRIEARCSDGFMADPALGFTLALTV